MDRSITEWLLALSEEYEKKEKKSELHQTIHDELLETLSLMTQESLPQDVSEPKSESTNTDSLPPKASPDPSQAAPTSSSRTPQSSAAPHHKHRSDEEILKALLELKNSGRLQRSFSQKAAGTFASILRPKKR